MNTNTHKHTFKPGRSGKIEICNCGRFRFVNLKPEDIITEIKPPSRLGRAGALASKANP